MSPVVKVARYLGVCGAFHPFPIPLDLCEMLDLRLTLLLTPCHVHIFSTLPCSVALSLLEM